MGNCCGWGESSAAVEKNAFQGEGQRLGSTSEPYRDTQTQTVQRDERIIVPAPAPIHESNLSAEELEQQRAERAAAAEARLKKQGGLPSKKKKNLKDAPLVGPNSKPLMTWSAG